MKRAAITHGMKQFHGVACLAVLIATSDAGLAQSREYLAALSPHVETEFSESETPQLNSLPVRRASENNEKTGQSISDYEFSMTGQSFDLHSGTVRVKVINPQGLCVKITSKHENGSPCVCPAGPCYCSALVAWPAPAGTACGSLSPVPCESFSLNCCQYVPFSYDEDHQYEVEITADLCSSEDVTIEAVSCPCP